VLIVAAAILAQRTLFRKPPIQVDAVRAENGTVEDLVANSEAGTVKTRSRARLGVELAGRVASIPHREGARVTQGTVLLELDSQTERTRLAAARQGHDAARASLEAARASAILARETYDRTEQLQSKGLASQEQLDEAKARRDSAEAEVRAAQARVRSAETAVGLAEDELNHIRIVAPFDGTIAHRYVEVGEQVVPGESLLELVSLSRLYVSAPIDERDAGRLRTGLPVRITVDAYPSAVWNARVTRLSPVVEEAKEQNRTLEVEADFPADSTQPDPRPGMTADVEIVLERQDGVLRVPTFSVIEGKRVLEVVKGRAVSRDVETGLRNWDWTEIRSGLSPGDWVVTSLDRPGLKPGVSVAIRAPAAAAPASPAAK
jgi:HlyD family secretion protein